MQINCSKDTNKGGSELPSFHHQNDIKDDSTCNTFVLGLKKKKKKKKKMMMMMMKMPLLLLLTNYQNEYMQYETARKSVACIQAFQDHLATSAWAHHHSPFK
ncbi:hypothetical protein IEQ34_009988 [Dendrobium chrysotoxum]|uniref:Uncharacterized protein n=1 Tax=Dendrobium chrysotoxum TaxID=161865 RepID=A0AAV7H4G7_DENCH|nr:hypothetical protein IEQ34_009988 [Dendrobium chrysotoxum]